MGRDRGTVIIKTLVLKYKKGLILGVLEVCSWVLALKMRCVLKVLAKKSLPWRQRNEEQCFAERSSSPSILSVNLQAFCVSCHCQRSGSIGIARHRSNSEPVPGPGFTRTVWCAPSLSAGIIKRGNVIGRTEWKGGGGGVFDRVNARSRQLCSVPFFIDFFYLLWHFVVNCLTLGFSRKVCSKSLFYTSFKKKRRWAN